MKKKDIQLLLKQQIKFILKSDNNIEYVAYPKFIIDAILKDYNNEVVNNE